jgi:hypothetical protein
METMDYLRNAIIRPEKVQYFTPIQNLTLEEAKDPDAGI